MRLIARTNDLIHTCKIHINWQVVPDTYNTSAKKNFRQSVVNRGNSNLYGWPLVVTLLTLPEFADLRHSADEKLLSDVTTNNEHVYTALSFASSVARLTTLRSATAGRSFERPARTDRLADCNFIQRMLYSNC